MPGHLIAQLHGQQLEQLEEDIRLLQLFELQNVFVQIAAGEVVEELRRVVPTVKTDEPFYLPGQTVVGYLRAEYFFGKPVAQGEVEIRGSLYTIERQELMTLRGTTDDEGRFDFDFALPTYFVGGAPEAETAPAEDYAPEVETAVPAEANTGGG